MENQKINLSSKNVFDEHYKKFIGSRRAVKLQNKFKDRTFDQRTKKFALVALVLSFGCTLFSAFSAHFYLLDIFNSLGSFAIAIVLTVIIIGCLEYGKRDTLPQFFKNWFQYKTLDITNLSIAIGLMALSIGSSFLGSHLIPSKLGASPKLISIDSVSTHYEGLIIAKTNEVQSYFDANNWKGRLDGSSRPTYNKFLDEKLTLENEKKTAISNANEANKQTILDHETRLKNEGVQLGYITLGSEFLLILLIGFLEYRDFRAVSQFAHIQNHESNNVGIENVETTIPKNTNDERKDGERLEPNQDTSNEGRTIVKGFNKGKSNGERKDGNNTKNCKHCGNEFTYKHWNKQYCSDSCRITAWELRTGKQLKKKSKSQ